MTRAEPVDPDKLVDCFCGTVGLTREEVVSHYQRLHPEILEGVRRDLSRGADRAPADGVGPDVSVLQHHGEGAS